MMACSKYVSVRNDLVTQRETVTAAWSTVDVALQRGAEEVQRSCAAIQYIDRTISQQHRGRLERLHAQRCIFQNRAGRADGSQGAILIFGNYINGEWRTGGATFENRNPANTNELVG